MIAQKKNSKPKFKEGPSGAPTIDVYFQVISFVVVSDGDGPFLLHGEIRLASF